MTTEQAPEKKASKKRLRSSSEPTIDPPEPTLQTEPNEVRASYPSRAVCFDAYLIPIEIQ